MIDTLCVYTAIHDNKSINEFMMLLQDCIRVHTPDSTRTVCRSSSPNKNKQQNIDTTERHKTSAAIHYIHSTFALIITQIYLTPKCSYWPESTGSGEACEKYASAFFDLKYVDSQAK